MKSSSDYRDLKHRIHNHVLKESLYAQNKFPKPPRPPVVKDSNKSRNTELTNKSTAKTELQKSHEISYGWENWAKQRPHGHLSRLQQYSMQYRRSKNFTNSMKVLRAIGKGDINIAISHDMQMLTSLEEDRKKIEDSQIQSNVYSGFSTIDDLSYVQFFNELVLENKKKRSKRQFIDDQLPEIPSQPPAHQFEEIKVNRMTLTSILVEF